MDDRTTGSGDAASEGESVPLTTAFRLLARRPRRQLLYLLHQRDDGAASLDALARRLAERGSEVGADDPSGLRVALHHVHLPKLDEAEVVEYDPDDGEVHYLGDPRLGDLLEWGICEEALD